MFKLYVIHKEIPVIAMIPKTFQVPTITIIITQIQNLWLLDSDGSSWNNFLFSFLFSWLAMIQDFKQASVHMLLTS